MNERNYRTPARLLKGSYTKTYGTNKKVYTPTEIVIAVSCRSYQGSEKQINGQIVIEDTFVIECNYRKDITSMDALEISGSTYEIINNPENINLENRKLLFKVKRYTGGV